MMDKRWRTGDLVRAIPITRGDLNQAISRVGYRPEHAPEPGKDRWYSWRDVVAIAVAQELRILGQGPKIAFGLVQDNLSPFLHASVKQPGDCAGLLWLIHPLEDRLGKGNRSEFVRCGDNDDLSVAVDDCPCIVVNVGRTARHVLDELQAQQLAAIAWFESRATAIANARVEFDAHATVSAE